MKKVLITGITGQDGYYLARQLIDDGCEVHGFIQRPQIETRKDPLYDKCTLHVARLDNMPLICSLLSQTRFDECYHLAASSFVGEKLADGWHTIQNNISCTHHLMAALHQFQPSCRVYFAGSSEMFGRPQTAPQTEQTSFTPRSAYGISKLASYHIVRNYRDDFGMYCAVGILYNHESPRRPREFVTRKITAAAAEIKAGFRQTVEVGDLDAKRDWGFAPDYVKAMRAIIRLPEPSDYVVSTGVLHSVRDICQVAFSHLGLDWSDHVRVNPAYGRIETQVPLLGCSDKIHRETGWQPVTSFETMIRLMVDADLERVSHMAP